MEGTRSKTPPRYLPFFLWRFLRNFFLRLWVAIFLRFRFRPQGTRRLLIYQDNVHTTEAGEKRSALLRECALYRPRLT